MPGTKSLLSLCLLAFLPALHLQAECLPTVAVLVPATACKSGTATVAVAAVPGATYAWTVDGGQIAGDASSDHVTIILGTNAKATASVTLTSGDCVSHGSGVIALHDPFGVNVVTPQVANAGEPLTIIWTYANGTPAKQTISGDFGVVALAPDVRNYTYTPEKSGNTGFVIDAVMKLPAVSAPPPASRQRAVAKSPVNASPCILAHAAATYAVGECVIPTVAIDAPASVTNDTKFDLSVRHQAGAVATWTITNGFPATATGDVVTITAGSTGQVGVSVRLTRASCTDSVDRTIAITPKPACGNPKATVSTSPASCGSATLNASFTGTPPFKGTWSDNVPFETNSTSLVRTITIPGNYSILRFQDAICEGTASGVAVVPALYPSATIIGKGNSCTEVDTATVYFSGKPPYGGCWLDGTCFQTSQSTLTKPITKAGWISLASGSDGTGCSFQIFGGVQAFVSPHVGLSKRCEWNGDNYVNVFLFYAGTTTGPNITWSDGVKTGQARMGIRPSVRTTYTVASISEGVCPAIWDTPRSFTIAPTPVPEFAPDSDDLCFGSVYTATLVTPPPPGTKIEWEVQAGTLFSGQGTNSIQYGAGAYSNGYPSINLGVVSTFTFADAALCPLTNRRTHRVVPVEPFGILNVDTVDPFHAGKTWYLSFRLGWDISDWSVTNSMNDTITLTTPCVPNGDTCYASYTSTHGPGKSTITLHAKNACKTKDFSAELTILP